MDCCVFLASNQKQLHAQQCGKNIHSRVNQYVPHAAHKDKKREGSVNISGECKERMSCLATSFCRNPEKRVASLGYRQESNVSVSTPNSAGCLARLKRGWRITTSSHTHTHADCSEPWQSELVFPFNLETSNQILIVMTTCEKEGYGVLLICSLMIASGILTFKKWAPNQDLREKETDCVPSDREVSYLHSSS